jgi:hypothetical protein
MQCASASERVEAGAVRSHITVLTEVTERKWMEARLRASLQKSI